MPLSRDLIAAVIAAVVTLSIAVVLTLWYLHRRRVQLTAMRIHAPSKDRPASFLNMSTASPTSRHGNYMQHLFSLNPAPALPTTTLPSRSLSKPFPSPRNVTFVDQQRDPAAAVHDLIQVPPAAAAQPFSALRPLPAMRNSSIKRKKSSQDKHKRALLPPIVTQQEPSTLTVDQENGGLSRAQSIRSVADSESLYSVASAPRSYHRGDRSFQPWALEAIPASPSAEFPVPQGTNDGYTALPLRATNRVSVIREALAPETYVNRRTLTTTGRQGHYSGQAMANPVRSSGDSDDTLVAS